MKRVTRRGDRASDADCGAMSGLLAARADRVDGANEQEG